MMVLFVFVNLLSAQNKQDKPKLVIGIVIDQMRYDYLIKFRNNFTKGGFLKLMNEGIFLKNVHYNYIPTYTAPGHASIYTGTTPRFHQIIANEWYDKKQKKIIYCVSTESVMSVGTNNDNGKMSPANMLASNITDELKLLNKDKSKVISISIKDRSAILPGGHLCDAAYWWDEATGNFISSSFYMHQLPQWVVNFNNQRLALQYLQKNWDLIISREKYVSSLSDSNQYEKSILNKYAPKFPYDFSEYVKNEKVSILKYTPYGNSILIDFAKECIINEKLGKNKMTDFLCMSFSSTDYIGHMYGTEALELEDAYYRLDRDLNNFISFLDKNVGRDNYLIFLTADHAAALNTQYLKDNKFNVNYFSEDKLKNDLKIYLFNKYNDSTLITEIINEQIFLNHDKISTLKINEDDLKKDIRKFCYRYDEVAEVYLSEDLVKSDIKDFSLYGLVANGFSPAKSGDIVLVLHPGNMDYSNKGTTHGSAYNYDTHVPLIFYGFRNRHIESHQFYRITQIAPTLSFLLNINIPNACFDVPIDEVLNNVNVDYPLNDSYMRGER